MFDASRDFNKTKGYKLIFLYNKKRKINERNFTNDLMDLNDLLYPTSLFNRNLLFLKSYKRSTVKSVLKDFGYELTYFKKVPNYHFLHTRYGYSVIIAFVPAESF